MSDHTSRTVWLFVLALLIASLLRADEKSAPSPEPVAKPGKQQGAAEKTSNAEKEITNSIGMKLVLIRAGNFQMGSRESDKHAGPAEKPQHRVRIKDPFYLGKYEVTRGEFRKFVTATKYKTDAEKDLGGFGYTGKKGEKFVQKPEFTWRNAGFEQTDEHPVVNVSWNDAVAFCQWLSKTEEKTYRLPTEAEWEWACRAGTIERWNCGDKEEDLHASANIADASLMAKWAGFDWAKNWDDGAPFTSAVGKYKANQFGLYDMHGNVWEWCADWYDEQYYTSSPTNDPSGAKSGRFRVLRGSSWLDNRRTSRSGWRARTNPFDWNIFIGFRVAGGVPDRTR